MIKETDFYVHFDLMNTAKNFTSQFDNKTTLNQPTGDFFYDPWIIKEQYQGTIWEKILNTLDVPQGEARLIILNPGESYMAHADIDDRYHLNIIGNNAFLIDISKQKMYPTTSDGRWYEMDAGRIHAATNYGDIPRAQLVVRKLLKRGKFYESKHVTIIPKQQIHDYRYQFDNQISPCLNELNRSKKMNNFQFSNDRVEFDIDLSAIQELSKFDQSIFHITYE